MPTYALDISGSWVFEPKIFDDSRGSFFEWFQDSNSEIETSEKFSLKQANCSISNKGVIRGIHFAKNPPGQSKYVTCFTGAVFDVLIDLRKKSPSFGKWTSVLIEAKHPKAVFIPSGVGHAFMALEDSTTFVYLCDQRYNPNNEFDIDPFDPTLNIDWPKNYEFALSVKDRNAPRFLDQMMHFSDF